MDYKPTHLTSKAASQFAVICMSLQSKYPPALHSSETPLFRAGKSLQSRWFFLVQNLSRWVSFHQSKGRLIPALLSWLLYQPGDLTAGLGLITALSFFFFFAVYRTILKIFPFPDAFLA